ncbi:hypothetical protein BDF22DRAFT_512472 [Syncephalis plumigaleata]|nr:hypothetical protein BDF22DRAFT_512472 [Syncephalis plumigaleata]
MHVDVDDDEAMLSSTFEDRINDLADQLHTAATTAFHDEIVDEAAIDHIKTILERVLTYSNQQMALILTRSKDVLAQVSDNQFAHLVNMMLNLLVANTSATTSYRVCLVQHLVLPKLCHATTRPTRHLQQLLADIARQEPHAYAHGILFHWPRVCSLETWHADTIRKTVQNIPTMLPYLDAVLCHWGSNPFSNNLVHTSIQPIQWNNTLYALATFLLELPMTSSTSLSTTTTRSDTIRILTRLLARQDAKTITGIKFGLLAIALARQNANHQSSSVEIATTLDDIANKMRPMQARQLRQCLQKTKLPSNGNNTNANDK